MKPEETSSRLASSVRVNNSPLIREDSLYRYQYSAAQYAGLENYTAGCHTLVSPTLLKKVRFVSECISNCPGHHARCGDGIGTQSCATAVESASLSAMTNCPGHHARCLPLPCDTFRLQLRFRALSSRNRSGATLRAHWRHL